MTIEELEVMDGYLKALSKDHILSDGKISRFWTEAEYMISKGVMKRRQGYPALISDIEGFEREQRLLDEYKRWKGKKEFIQTKQLEFYDEMAEKEPILTI